MKKHTKRIIVLILTMILTTSATLSTIPKKNTSYFGGLIGNNTGTLNNSYSTGEVDLKGYTSNSNSTTTLHAGGLIGVQSSGSAMNNFTANPSITTSILSGSVNVPMNIGYGAGNTELTLYRLSSITFTRTGAASGSTYTTNATLATKQVIINAIIGTNTYFNNWRSSGSWDLSSTTDYPMLNMER